MGLFNLIRNAFVSIKVEGTKGEEQEFFEAIDDAWREFSSKRDSFWSVTLKEVETWNNRVKNWPDKKKVRFIHWLAQGIHIFLQGKRNWSGGDKQQQKHYVTEAYLDALFRNKLVMDDEDVASLYEVFSKYKRGDWSWFTRWPINLMLNQLEKQRKDQEISPSLRVVLENIKREIGSINNNYEEKERIKMIEKIDSMLFTAITESTIKPARFLGEDALADFANPAIENLPQEEKVLWYELLPLAQKASGSKPSNKYLNDSLTIIKKLGTDKFKKTIHEWLQFLVDLKEKEQQHSIDQGNGHFYNYSSYDYITSVNAEAVKGLVWACSHFHDNKTIQTIAALAERTYRKIPGKGPTAASVGNACLYVLYKSKGLDGIGQLSRLKLRIKQASTQAAIDKYLEAAAKEQGVTVSEIEDMAVDDCGFEDGRRVYELDEYRVELVIESVGKIEIKFFKPDGSLQKSVPAILKDKHAARLKKIKDITKQAEQTLVAQRDRIDRMFRSERILTWKKFEEYYLRHGLMCYLAKGIIWNFHQSGKNRQAIYVNSQWVNADNEIVPVTDQDEVSIWHPVQGSLQEIRLWREFLNFHQLQQPLKQAYREVYLLTDAELNTKSYSNRMAAHILRQHQFNSLAKSRGWRYALMGAFDNGMDSGKATLSLPDYNLTAEYWIYEVNADDAFNETGIWNYVSTDQLRFVNNSTNETIDLVDIRAIVLSEVLRDVDLFVGVASVGNDPTWNDSGGLPAYRDYWTSYSFGELSEVAKSRKEILSNLVPRLKIKDVATIKDKFLVVKGKLRTYKIHIGSTNILMEPNDQYLCIVPDRSQKNHTENLFLPFEGDSGLSIILSKAFLLAEDEKITDTTITSQINRK